MDDRQLLEDAARAAGHANGIYGELSGDAPVMYFQTIGTWDPLGDDGDALRLAARVGLAVNIDIIDGTTHAHADQCWKAAPEEHAGDPYAATRRAITRAAAEIGKQMREAGNG